MSDTLHKPRARPKSSTVHTTHPTTIENGGEEQLVEQTEPLPFSARSTRSASMEARGHHDPVVSSDDGSGSTTLTPPSHKPSPDDDRFFTATSYDFNQLQQSGTLARPTTTPLLDEGQISAPPPIASQEAPPDLDSAEKVGESSQIEKDLDDLEYVVTPSKQSISSQQSNTSVASSGILSSLSQITNSAIRSTTQVLRQIYDDATGSDTARASPSVGNPGPSSRHTSHSMSHSKMSSGTYDEDEDDEFMNDETLIAYLSREDVESETPCVYNVIVEHDRLVIDTSEAHTLDCPICVLRQPSSKRKEEVLRILESAKKREQQRMERELQQQQQQQQQQHISTVDDEDMVLIESPSKPLSTGATPLATAGHQLNPPTEIHPASDVVVPLDDFISDQQDPALAITFTQGETKNHGNDSSDWDDVESLSVKTPYGSPLLDSKSITTQSHAEQTGDHEDQSSSSIFHESTIHDDDDDDDDSTLHFTPTTSPTSSPKLGSNSQRDPTQTPSFNAAEPSHLNVSSSPTITSRSHSRGTGQLEPSVLHSISSPSPSNKVGCTCGGDIDMFAARQCSVETRAKFIEQVYSSSTPSLDDHHHHREGSSNSAPQPANPAARPLILKVYTMSWNLLGQVPTTFTSTLPQGVFDIYIISLQECGALSSSFMYNNSTTLSNLVIDALGDDYQILRIDNLQCVYTIVAIRSVLSQYVHNIQSEKIATGYGDVFGNKGGVAIRFFLGATSICAVGAHFNSGQNALEKRNQDYHKIAGRLTLGIENCVLSTRKNSIFPYQHFRNTFRTATLSAQSLAMLNPKYRQYYQHHSDISSRNDVTFWLGDLNYRIHSADKTTVEWLLSHHRHHALLQLDQLLMLYEQKEIFYGYKEGVVVFPPTYKYDANAQCYDTSAKMRIPSWTDRILYCDTCSHCCHLRQVCDCTATKVCRYRDTRKQKAGHLMKVNADGEISRGGSTPSVSTSTPSTTKPTGPPPPPRPKRPSTPSLQTASVREIKEASSPSSSSTGRRRSISTKSTSKSSSRQHTSSHDSNANVHDIDTPTQTEEEHDTSMCKRILLEKYGCYQHVTFSDHRPVYAHFLMSMDLSGFSPDAIPRPVFANNTSGASDPMPQQTTSPSARKTKHWLWG